MSIKLFLLNKRVARPNLNLNYEILITAVLYKIMWIFYESIRFNIKTFKMVIISGTIRLINLDRKCRKYWISTLIYLRNTYFTSSLRWRCNKRSIRKVFLSYFKNYINSGDIISFNYANSLTFFLVIIINILVFFKEILCAL